MDKATFHALVISFGAPTGNEKICVRVNNTIVSTAKRMKESAQRKGREATSVEKEAIGTGSVSAARICSNKAACDCCSSLDCNLIEYAFGLLVGAYPGTEGSTPCRPANAPRDSSV